MGQRLNSCILIFVKAPQPGRVKSRLARTIGKVHATELYKRFVLDILERLTGLNCPVQIWFTPVEQALTLQQWLGPTWRYQPQVGADLGKRLGHAFQCAFGQGYERVVVIGSDSPDLPLAILHTALAALENHEAIIGPSEDGGYYTIGFTRSGFLPTVFEDIPWSTEAVLGTTLSRLRQAQRTLLALPVWYDVDTIETLAQFYQQNRQRSTHTIQYLRRYQHEIFPALPA